jgi:SAM-dependent methyltransferase
MSAVDEIYRARFAVAGLEKRNRVWKVLCAHFFRRFVPDNATVLDLACGYGEFINNIAAARKYAIDLNPDSPGHLNGDIKYHNGLATELDFIPDGTLDVAFTSNFLEHLPSKAACDDVLRAVWRKLKPGGRFMILGPNIKYAYREYWDFYDHYLPLSHLSLVEGLSLAGFAPETVVPRFLPYTMNSSMPTHDLLIRAYLLLPIAWPIFGKQFFVTALKRG